MRRRGIAAAVALAAAVAVGILFAAAQASSPSPRFAIAYVRGTAASTPQVWLTTGDGRDPRRLGPGTEPLLAPAGSYVAASTAASDSGPALLVYGTAGSTARRFFDVRHVTAAAEAWSPDSRYLAVSLSSTDPLSDAPSGLAVIDTHTWSDRVIAHGPIYGASFAPDGSDRIAYAAASGPSVSAPVDVYVAGPDGNAARRITADGRSLYPVWGETEIAFAHERLRPAGAPVYEVWTMRADGSAVTGLTHVRVPPLIDGLVPVSFAGSGAWLLAQYEGQDTDRAWAISLARGQAHQLSVEGQAVTGAALSRNGSLALVDVGGYLNPPDAGAIDALPLDGSGRPRLLVPHGSDPTWNR